MLIKHLLYAVTTGDPKTDQMYSSSPRKCNLIGKEAPQTDRFNHQLSSVIEIKTLTDGNADSESQVHRDRSNRAEESFLEDAKSEMSLRCQVGARGRHPMN